MRPGPAVHPRRISLALLSLSVVAGALFVLMRTDRSNPGASQGTDVAAEGPRNDSGAPVAVGSLSAADPSSMAAPSASERLEASRHRRLRVFLDGAPLPRARAMLLPWNSSVEALAASAEGIAPDSARELGREIVADTEGWLTVEDRDLPCALCVVDERAAPTGVLLTSQDCPPRIEAKKGARVHGHVLDSNDQPAPGIQVAARWAALPVQPLAASALSPAERLARRLVVRRALSAVDGTYSISGLADGSHDVWTEQPGLTQDKVLVLLPTDSDADVILTVGPALIVRGVVLDADSLSPITGALVTGLDVLAPWQPNFCGIDQTDENGSFEIRLTERVSDARLHVVKEGYANPLLPLRPNPSQRLIELNVLLAREVTIEGKAVDRRGHPAASLTLDVWDQNATVFVSRAITGPDGSFLARNLKPDTPYLLFLHGEGYAGARLPGVTAPAKDIKITIDRTFRLTGRLVADQTRFPNASVRLVETADGAHTAESTILRATVDESTGRFAIDGVYAGQWMLDAFCDELAPARVYPLVVDPEEPLEDIEVRMQRGATLRGQVVDSRSGLGIPDATVALADTDTFGREVGLLPISTSTDAEGMFLLSPVDPDGGFFIHIEAPGYAESSVLVRKERLTGTTRFPLGRGAGLEVALEGEEAPVEWSVEVYGQGRKSIVRSSTETAPIVITGLEPGHAFVDVRLAGRVIDFPAMVHVNYSVYLVEDETERITLSLRESGSIAGRVVSRDPLKLEDRFYVRAIPVPKGGRRPVTTRVTPDGRFAFPWVAPGGWRLQLYDAGRADEWASFVHVEVHAGRTTETEIRVFDRGVFGRITTKDGSPLPGARLIVVAHETPRIPYPVAEGSSRADGSYRVTGLPAGDYELHLTQKGFAAPITLFSLPEDSVTRQVDIQALPEGRIAARLDWSAPGLPRREGTTRVEPLFDPSPFWLPSEVLRTGVREFYSLPPGRYLTLLSVEGAFPGLALVDLAEGERREVTLRPRPAGSLRVRVKSASRGALSGVPVVVFDPETGTDSSLWLKEGWVRSEPGGAVTDGDGWVTFHGVPAGGALEVRAAGASETVDVTLGEPAEVRITLFP